MEGQNQTLIYNLKSKLVILLLLFIVFVSVFLKILQ